MPNCGQRTTSIFSRACDRNGKAGRLSGRGVRSKRLKFRVGVADLRLIVNSRFDSIQEGVVCGTLRSVAIALRRGTAYFICIFRV